MAKRKKRKIHEEKNERKKLGKSINEFDFIN